MQHCLKGGAPLIEGQVRPEGWIAQHPATWKSRAKRGGGIGVHEEKGRHATLPGCGKKPQGLGIAMPDQVAETMVEAK